MDRLREETCDKANISPNDESSSHITMLFLLLVMKAPTKETLKSTFVSNSHSLPAFETVYSRQKFSDKFG
jgi:hypothetical protein